MNKSKLITWDNRGDKIDLHSEIEFLKECEKNCNISISGKNRFINILRFIQNFSDYPKQILDVGGNQGTAKWFKAKFPEATITILNTSSLEIGKWKPSIKTNAENFNINLKYDLIFIGELLEHSYNPDGIIASSLLALMPDGLIIITTPNLACLYNRIFLLLGWSLGGYYPSIRYMTGNPFFKNTSGQFGIVTDHKSVFTWKGLIELLKLYDLKIIESYGYDVINGENSVVMPAKNYSVTHYNLRILLNHFIPKGMRTDMMFICQLKKNPNLKHISKGILKKNIWG